MIYLAAPYSHADAEVRQRRYMQATEVARRLLDLGHLVFSPLTHSHPIARLGPPVGDANDALTGFERWADLDLGVLSLCDRLIVLALAGWKESRGVAAELRECERRRIPVSLLFVPCEVEALRFAVDPACDDLSRALRAVRGAP